MSLSQTYPNAKQAGYSPQAKIHSARLFPYYQKDVLALKNILNSGNACGQSAMAILLAYWKRIKPSQPLSTDVKGFYQAEWGKPDMVGGLFGTSIERVRDVLIRYGLNATGYNTSRNTVSSANGKKKWLATYVNSGHPVAAILDMGFMYGGMGAHWVVVLGYKSGRFAVGNFTPGYYINAQKTLSANKEGITWMPADEFMKGWQSNLPYIHFGAVTCRP